MTSCEKQSDFRSATIGYLIDAMVQIHGLKALQHLENENLRKYFKKKHLCGTFQKRSD